MAEAREHASNTEKLSDVGVAVASTLDRDAIVQTVTDIATELTHAQFGAFFYNVHDPDSGNAYMLYTLSGASREAFAKVSATARDRRVCSNVLRRRARAPGRCDAGSSLRTRMRRISACLRGTCRSAATSRYP